MKEITKIKNEVEKFIKKYGFKKTAMENTRLDSDKVYYRYGGSLTVCCGNITYAFGSDPLFGCSAHICGYGSDCGTLARWAQVVLEKHVTGEKTESQIAAEWL